MNEFVFYIKYMCMKSTNWTVSTELLKKKEKYLLHVLVVKMTINFHLFLLLSVKPFWWFPIIVIDEISQTVHGLP